MKNSRGASLIAQGCTTYSKRKDQFVEGVYPEYYQDMKGVDTVCGLGSNLIGWRNNYALPSRMEPKLAYRLNKIFPFMERMKFVKTGSAACEAAVRIARAKKQGLVLGMGYHGCHNIFISAESPGSGTRPEGYVKYDTLQDIIGHLVAGGPISAVIVEPVMLDVEVKSALKALRLWCTKRDVCLIFDEIITGFRVPKYSFSNWWGITPDIICVGKALGNGYPIAVVGGSKKYMDAQGYFISNTHNGEESGLCAALETLDYLTPKKLDEFWKRGEWFCKEINKVLKPINVQLVGYATRGTWKGDEVNRAIFWQEMLRRGVFLGKAWFLNFNHTKEVLDKILWDAIAVVANFGRGKLRLEGKLPQEAFKRN